MTSTESTTEAPVEAWRQAKELLDRMEASGLLDGAPVGTVVINTLGLSIHIRDREHAARIAAAFGDAGPETSVSTGGLSLWWRGRSDDGIQVNVYGFVPVDLEALVKASVMS